VNRELLHRVVVNGSGLHLRCVISIAKLSKAEAAHMLKAIALLHELAMTLSVEACECATKQVELDCELSGQVSVDVTKHLVGGENVLWICLEIEDRNDTLITHALDSSVSSCTLLVQGQDVFICEGFLVIKDVLPFCDLFGFITEKGETKVLAGFFVEFSEDLDTGV